MNRRARAKIDPILSMPKERPQMRVSRVGLLAILVLVICSLAMPLASASAEEPWWQVLTGSRPTHLWEPTDNVQEVEVQPAEFGSALKVEVKEKVVGCLGSGLFGAFTCFGNTGFATTETAAQFEEMLEGAFETSAVEVTGGPVGTAPFVVTTVGREVPTIGLTPIIPGMTGSATGKTLSSGGSGRVVLTFTNLGSSPVDGTSTPVTIVDKLPEGVEATGVEAFAGDRDADGPVNCAVKSPAEVVCTFENTLPSYEAIEVEIAVTLPESSPEAGALGKVTVSGGNAPPESEPQDLQITDEPVPFGIEKYSSVSEEEKGDKAEQAGSHPYQVTTTIQMNSGNLIPGKTRKENIVEQPAMPRNFRFTLPAGLVGNATVLPRCPMADFLASTDEAANECSPEAALGVASVTANENNNEGALLGFLRRASPVFNLPPRDGEPARLGFTVLGNPVIIDTEVDPDNHYKIIGSVNNTTQLVALLSSTVSLWGYPADPRHDNARGWECVYRFGGFDPCQRPAGLTNHAFFREPVSCVEPVEFGVEVEPWNVPLGSVVESASSSSSPMTGCNQVPFGVDTSGAPSSKLASNPSGFSFEFTQDNVGWQGIEAIGEGQAKKIEVTLPKGMTINPSQGAGLVGCSPADYARETATSAPGAGCPNASKIGEVQFGTPLLKEEARGSVYVASPYDNPFGTLLALYIVAKIPERGVLIKQAGRVDPDPVTGQLTTTFDDLPQVSISFSKFRLREGGRASLVTPPACGTYDIVSRFTPWSASNPDNPLPEEVVTETTSFKVERGVDGGACPSGGVPPFHPELNAGTVNNAAGSYSPFNLRLLRNDGEQEFTNFSIKLPPGVIGKLAGIEVCSDAAIAAARARTGHDGGLEEIEHPSCPSNSQVGRTLVGAGVGGSLTYVPGKVYLAGPFNGAPLSVAAITAARVGPFDLGTVVIREALKINPETAEVFVDPTGSDPIPHIIQGIPVHARDIRVYVDRPDFVLNPTSCSPTSTASTVLGSGLDFGSAGDDEPVTVTSPFQAADCVSLGFKPKLSLHLKGGTKRGDNPKLRAVLQPRSGDANIAKIQVTLPHSEFIEQGHFKTICTRVQFAAGAIPGEACPKNSIYGYARVFTPLLDDPIEGPVFLRSSNHPLPDLVMALHNNQINLNVDGRVDSVKGGRLRGTFELLPDAPVTKAVLNMQGGRKGLFVNSTDLCRRKHNAIVSFVGQNGKVHDFNTPLKPQCGKKSKKSRAR
ncbi:MAG TPA: hypothetical protein VFN18_06720 [Solirubrobacterales bacterium]|nr:hypothetical protein [Solirubrobacterales bacterium]